MGILAFGEDFLDIIASELGEEGGALWNGGTIPGRFWIDPYDVPTGPIEPGLGSMQTWFRCNSRRIPGRWPDLGDHLVIRGRTYEVAQVDEPDDQGEIGFRLIKHDIGAPPPWNPVGRPSRRAEIVRAYEAAKTEHHIDAATTMVRVVKVVRQRLGADADPYGLNDSTVRRILAPMHHSIRDAGPTAPSRGEADPSTGQRRPPR